MSTGGDGDRPDRTDHADADGEPTAQPGSTDDLLVNPRERRLRAGWRLAWWVLVVVFAAAVAFALQQELVRAVPAGVPAALAAVAGGVATYAAVTGVTLAYARRVDHRTAAGLGLGGRRFWAGLAVGLGVGVVMATAVLLAGIALGTVQVVDVLVVDPTASVVPGLATDGATAGALGPLPLLVMLLAFFVAVGVAEEVLVRGYVLTNLAEGLAGLGPIDERRAIAMAVLATAGLFGLLHYANPNAGLWSAAAITAVGVVLGWTYAVSGDLGLPIGIHVAWNFAIAAVFGFPVSGLATPVSVLYTVVRGDPLLFGGRFGPEAGLVMVLPLAIAVVVTALWVRRTTGDLALQRSIARFRR